MFYGLLRFSITCESCSSQMGDASAPIFEPCSSQHIMQIRFTLPSIMSRTSQETSVIFQRGQQVTLLVRDWRISIHFACLLLLDDHYDND